MWSTCITDVDLACLIFISGEKHWKMQLVATNNANNMQLAYTCNLKNRVRDVIF